MQKVHLEESNDVWALVLVHPRAFLLTTKEKHVIQPLCSGGWVDPFITLCLRARGDAGMRRREEVVTTIVVSRQRLRNKLRHRLARREKSRALAIMICWVDREPVVRSLETAATRSLRPSANDERTAKRKIYLVQRHRPLQGLGCRGKFRTSMPLSLFVTENQGTSCGQCFMVDC